VRVIQVLAAIGILALSGCATREVLEAHSAEPPGNVDFSGTWVIRGEDSADQRSRRVQQDTRRDKRAGLVHVFLETGKTLQISQTPYGFFVSLDRSIVEEFRFGEVRTVSVGEIVGQRVSGWDGQIYVVETLDKNGMKLTERFSLNEGRDVLQREITFRSRKQVEETVVQQFDKVDP